MKVSTEASANAMRVFQSQTAVQNHPQLRQEVGLYSPTSVNHWLQAGNQWEEALRCVRQFSDQGSAQGTLLSPAEITSIQRMEDFTPKRVLYVLTSMVTYDIYCSVRKTRSRTMYAVSSHFQRTNISFIFINSCL